MKKIIFLFLSIGLVAACKNNPKDDLKERYKERLQEVIDVHDEVMPKMSKISSSISTLEDQLQTAENPEKVEKAIADLKYGYDYMMQWMRDFSNEFPDALDPEDYTEEEYKERFKMLEKQKEEVLKMQEAVNSSLKQANKLIEKNQ
ncbi:hypothetical protein [Haloflavibacter putidus]|uniref:Uncharacterized protein n=1 Tax=Haloflavibacter putidus TaxID=2576776 RepID=A0A507ZVP3_9FLAO|nr:hypothetical protein [Haloflavibacter putidus]TQD37662.1 hypothetical protein FKR84_09320 [Haloflavibacter putidus]